MIHLTSMVNGTVSRAAELDTLLGRVAQCDTDALAALYRQTKASVFGYALSLLKNPYDAEDVLHDCFVSIYSAAEGYVSSGKPMAWILTITRNLCLQKLRSSRACDVPLEELEPYLRERAALTLEDRALIEYCLAALSDSEREILLLHAVSGFKHREIADMLALPLATVLSKYSRSLKKVRTHLAKEERTDDK